MRTCPGCGADRDGALRFCPACGLDLWRAAAGGTSNAGPGGQGPNAAGGGWGAAGGGGGGAGAGPAGRPARSGPGAGPLIAIGSALLLVAAGATVVMSGVIPSGLPGGRPTATPRALTPNEALIRAFFREVRDPNAAFLVATDGLTTFTGPIDMPAVAAKSTVRIQGDDWVGTETVESDGETILDVEMAIVDGIGYVRDAGGEWVTGEVPARLQPVSPFRRISTVTEVEYLSTRTINGRPMHTLVVTKWLGGRDFSDLLRSFASIRSQVSRLEVLVDSFGVPASASLTAQVVATDGRDSLTIDATATYRFSDWGEVAPIVPPSAAPSGPDD